MDVRDYLKTLELEQRERFATACGTTVDYLKQIAGGHSRPGAVLARRIATESGGKISLMKLRPDIWQSDEAA